MTLMTEIAMELACGAPNRLHLPEHRQIELYTKRKTLDFADRPEPLPHALLAGAARAFMVLESFLAARLGLGEGRESWAFYSSLPRDTMTGKLIAEIYRTLRVARLVLFHPHGHVDLDDGIVKINGAVGRLALSLEISASGLTLLETAVAYYISAESGPYPPAYVEAMLAEYFLDISAEIKRFADEDRVLYQFRRPLAFCRHFRFDCDNPRIKDHGETLEIEIGALYKDKARYPIDFFAIIDNALHIIPVEALQDNRIARADLPKWQAATPDGAKLPADFRARFGREVNIAGQPMT